MKKILSTLLLLTVFSTNTFAKESLDSIVDSKAIRKLTFQLARTFKSHVDHFKVNSLDTLEMVKQYAVLVYGLEEAKTFDFWADHETLEMDEPTLLGTLKTSVAVKEVSYEANWIVKDPTDTEEVRKLQHKIVDQVGLLILSGAEFGFDAHAQNGCSAATPYLLILDTKLQKVYGIDLHHCTK